MSKKTSKTPNQQELDAIVNSLVADKDVVQLEDVKVNPNKVAKVKNNLQKAKLPNCPTHHVPMRYDTIKMGWICSMLDCKIVARSMKPSDKKVKHNSLKLFANNEKMTVVFTFKQGKDEIVLPNSTIFQSLQSWEEYENTENESKLIGHLTIPIYEGQYKDEN